MPTQLTTAQLTALKNDIAANTNTIPAGQTWTNAYAGLAVNAVPNTSDGNATIAGWYNQTAVPAFYGNYATVPTGDIFNAITWKKLTPTDAVPTTPDLTVQVWMARNAMCQTLQMNIQTMLLGRTTLDATKGKIRTGFQDSLSSVPSGASGALVDAGWAAVQKILCRQGTYAEKLYADSSTGAGDTNTTAATFTFEGKLITDDVDTARNS